MTQTWWRWWTALGDSATPVLVSLIIFLISLGVSMYLDQMEGAVDPRSLSGWLTSLSLSAQAAWFAYRRPAIVYNHNVVGSSSEEGRSSKNPTGVVVSRPQLEAFHRDGVMVIRGLLDHSLLDRLDQESRTLLSSRPPAAPKKSFGTQFHTVSHGVLYRPPPPSLASTPLSPRAESNLPDAMNPFLQVALFSAIPSVVAQLLGHYHHHSDPNSPHIIDRNNRTTTIRVLRDIFLAKDEDAYICGWHVDDLGFWPATPESPGINAWIALDDMPVANGGGLALAVGSHEASWRHEAYNVTGASTSFPTQGYASAADLLAQRPGAGTCNLQQAAPHLHQRMEQVKRIYSIQRGDVIFHTRWLFHRTVPFEREYVAQQQQQQQQQKERSPDSADHASLLYRRYSIRYSPGSAVIPPGYGTELSVLWDPSLGGRTADQVADQDGPWYLQAWPHPSATELAQLADLVQNKLPVAQQRQAERKREMTPFLERWTCPLHTGRRP